MNESTRSTTGAAVTHRFVTGAHPIVQPLAYTHFLRYQKSRRGQYTHKRTECKKKSRSAKSLLLNLFCPDSGTPLAGFASGQKLTVSRSRTDRKQVCVLISRYTIYVYMYGWCNAVGTYIKVLDKKKANARYAQKRREIVLGSRCVGTTGAVQDN